MTPCSVPEPTEFGLVTCILTGLERAVCHERDTTPKDRSSVHPE